MDVFSSIGSSIIAGISSVPGTSQNSTGPQTGTRPENSRNKGTEDKVNLSPEGRQASREASGSQNQKEKVSDTDENTALTSEEQKQLQELKARDREVRIHEQAHLAAAGQYAAGGPSFTYQQGPDGNRYAIGGEVPIDVSKEATPEETIQKMTVVRQAALAPAEPSSADRQIAAQASMTAAQARQELAQQNTESAQETTETGSVGAEDNAARDQVTDADQNESPADAGGFTTRAMIDAYSAIQALG